MASCVLHPQVKGGIPSPLYTKLKQYLGSTELADKYYYRVITELFKKMYPAVKFDENNEPLFEDLLEICDLKSILADDEVLANLNKQYSEVTVNYENIKLLQLKVVEFNDGHLGLRYAAKIESTETGAIVKIVRKAEVTEEEKQNIKYNLRLNEKLEHLLNNWGVKVGSLTELEESLGINGVMEPYVANAAAVGIREVIRIAKGERGLKVLPEEFGHWIVDATEDSALKTRMLNQLHNEDILLQVFGDEYQTYKELYDNNIDLLAEEALGKLISQVLLRNLDVLFDLTLLKRYLQSIKSDLSKHDESLITDIIHEVEQEVFEFVANTIDGNYKFKTQSSDFKKRLYNVSSLLPKTEQLLSNIISLEFKRLSIYKERINENESLKSYHSQRKLLINNLQAKLNDHQALLGIVDYLQDSINVLNSLTQSLMAIDSKQIHKLFELLRHIKNYLASYGVMINLLNKDLASIRTEASMEEIQQVRALINLNLLLVKDIGVDWQRLATEKFAKFLAPMCGDVIVEEMKRLGYDLEGVTTNEEVAELLVTTAAQDVSMFNRLMERASASNDIVIRMLDSTIKKQKHLARFETIEKVKELQKRALQLEKAGYSDYSQLYRRDAEGNLDGRLLQLVDLDKYKKDLREAMAAIEAEYKGNTSLIKKKKREWFLSHNLEEQRKTKKGEYINRQYLKLSKELLEFVDWLVELKDLIEAPLLTTKGIDTNLSTLAPLIRRDFLERVKQESLGNQGKYLFESIKDNFVIREDETEMIDQENATGYSVTKLKKYRVIADFEGNQVRKLPVYYTKKLEDMNDLSTDIVSTMSAYISMATEYKYLNDVIDELEVGGKVLESREIQDDTYEVIRDLEGNEVERRVLNKGSKSTKNFLQQLEDLYNMLLYGKKKKVEYVYLGEHRVNLGKLADTLKQTASKYATLFSKLTGIANFNQNTLYKRIEAMSKKFFNLHEITQGNLIVDKELPKVLQEYSSRVKTAKLSLYNEKYNVLQDHRNKMKSMDWHKKGMQRVFLDEDLPLIWMNMGDYKVLSSMGVSMGIRQQLIDTRTNTPVTLWDALEVEYLDKNNPDLGARLVMPEYIKKEDGTAWTVDDDINHANRIRGVENDLFGVYNEDDLIAIKLYAAGRLFLHYRDWMVPLFMNRWASKKFNFDTQEEMEGFYRTYFRYIWAAIKAIRYGEFQSKAFKRYFTEEDMQNIYKARTELVAQFILAAMVFGLSRLSDDDDEDGKYTLIESDSNLASVANMLYSDLYYSIYRLHADTASLTPTPQFVAEIFRLFKNPIMAMSYFSRVISILLLFNPDSYTEEVKTGIYKGHTKAGKIVLSLIPYLEPIIKGLDPELAAKVFK